MTPIECEWEEDVLAAIGTGRWPERTDASLRRHVQTCAVCQDVVTVAGAFARELDVNDTDALRERVDDRLPEASLIWWRAQMRAREDAARLAARPITVAQAVAFASIVGVLGAALGASSLWLQAGVHWVGTMAGRLDPRGLAVPLPVATALADHGLLMMAIGACVMLTPIAVYFAMREN